MKCNSSTKKRELDEPTLKEFPINWSSLTPRLGIGKLIAQIFP
jgi:hypothetical protein